jgi:hypothetical protein
MENIYSYVHGFNGREGMIVASKDDGITWTPIAEASYEYGPGIVSALNYRPDEEHAHCDEMIRSIMASYTDFRLFAAEVVSYVKNTMTDEAGLQMLSKYGELTKKHESFGENGL